MCELPRSVERPSEPQANALTFLLGLFCPREIELPMLRNAITQIKIDQALVRNTRFFGHVFEILDDILTHANGDLLLEL